MIGRETMQPIWDFIDHHGGRQPFFLWYAPFLPHTPYDAPPEYRRIAQAAGPPDWLLPYYANIAWFDATVGELLGYLAQKQLLENTLIVFVADNGLRPGPARPTRQDARSKYSPFEDGLRTPILLRWDGRIQPADHPQAVSTVDLVPTILAAAGLADAIAPQMTGRSLLPSALGIEPLAAAPVFGAIYPSDAASLDRPSRNIRARWVRSGNFKLIVPGAADPLPLQLFDLAQDPGETVNLAHAPTHAAIVTGLRRLLDNWWPATGNAPTAQP